MLHHALRGKGYVTPSGSLLLDAIAASITPVAVHSLRRVLTSYTGPLCRLRRSSDNTEQDIGYDGSNVLDVAAAAAFIGGGSGFFRTWYDQSGNGAHAQQSSTTLQPQYEASAMNSLPCAKFDGSNDYMRSTLAASHTGTKLWTGMSIQRVGHANSMRFVAMFTTANSSDWQQATTAVVHAQDNGPSRYNELYRNGAISSGVQLTNGTPAIVDAYFDASVGVISKDGSARPSGASTGSFNFNLFQLGAGYHGNALTWYYNGRMHECFLFPDLPGSTERGNVITDMKTRMGL
jgi:hypothetical protein